MANSTNGPSLTGSDREPSRLAAAPMAPGRSGFLSTLACFCALRAGTARGPGSLSLATLLGLLTFAVPVAAQPSFPHIGYVYPAGGRQGAVFQVAVGGQYLNNATNAYISGPGVQAAVVD